VTAPETISQQARRVRQGITALNSRLRTERPPTLSLNVLAVLGRLIRNGSMTAGEVAAQLGAQPQSLTRTFAAAEQAGYLTRFADPDDRRQSILTITADGRAAVADEMRPRDRWLSAAMADYLTAEERALLVAAVPLLERLADRPPTVSPRRES
jgi:DNA-binding MarR family transcriptional regulator